MCQHTDARPELQAASGITLLARLCDVEQLPIEALRYASAALSSVAVSPNFKVRCISSTALHLCCDADSSDCKALQICDGSCYVAVF